MHAASPTLHFSRVEYADRLDATRTAMEAKGLDALVSVDPSNMAWLTGYDGWSFYVPQCVVVGPDGDPFWFGRGMDAPGAARTTYLADADIVAYPDRYVMSDERHPMDYLAGVLTARGCGQGRIGVEMDNYYYSARAHASLDAHLPDAVLVDATGLVNWRRIIKSPAEVDFMRVSARIVEKMHERIVEVMEPGVRKNEVVAEIYRTGITGVDGHGGDYPAIVPLTPTGIDASAAHLTWDDKPLELGAGTFFEIAGVFHRYHVPQSRTVYLGTPPQHFFDAETALVDSIAAGLDAARPGATCHDMHRAFITELRSHGFDKESRAGYSIGLSYPPDWGERNLSIRDGDLTELRPGMTIHFMPALWQDDWGLEITEPILITDGGAEPLCTTPRQLFVKD